MRPRSCLCALGNDIQHSGGGKQRNNKGSGRAHATVRKTHLRAGWCRLGALLSPSHPRPGGSHPESVITKRPCPCIWCSTHVPGAVHMMSVQSCTSVHSMQAVHTRMSKGNAVVPLICETLGGVNRDAYRTLYKLHELATTEGTATAQSTALHAPPPTASTPTTSA